jgi:hypothetical protein
LRRRKTATLKVSQRKIMISRNMHNYGMLKSLDPQESSFKPLPPCNTSIRYGCWGASDNTDSGVTRLVAFGLGCLVFSYSAHTTGQPSEKRNIKWRSL